MAEGRTFTLGETLWAVAFATLGLAALLTAPDYRAVISLTLVGHALTVLAIALDDSAPDTLSTPRGATYTIATLAVGLVGEAAGGIGLLALGAYDLAAWFLVALSFAAAGIVTTLRRVPGDNVFGCQIFFHGTFLSPLAPALIGWLFASSYADQGGDRPLGIAAAGVAVLVIRTVWIPLLFVTLLAVLTFNLSRVRQDRGPCWDVLVAHQAVFAVIVFRWAANGL